MLVVYPIGVPLYYALTLFRNREELTALRHLELSVANEEQRIALGKFLTGSERRAYEPEIAEAAVRKAELEGSYAARRDALPGALRKLTSRILRAHSKISNHHTRTS